jgi:hypothetical protein
LPRKNLHVVGQNLLHCGKTGLTKVKVALTIAQ